MNIAKDDIYYIATVKLNISKYEEDILNKRMEIARRMYNICLKEFFKRYSVMQQSKKYRIVRKMSQGSDRNSEFQKMYEIYGITTNSMSNFMKHTQHKFKKNIDERVVRSIIKRCYNRFFGYMTRKYKSVSYIRYGEMNSIDGYNNLTGLRIRDKRFLWKGLNIPLNIKKDDYFVLESLKNSTLKFSRVIRKIIRGKCKFYLQMVFYGKKPMKFNSQTGEIKHNVGVGDVGLDIGTQTIAISSNTDVKIFELADRVEDVEREKRLLLRKMVRSRMANNPNNYNEDGSYKKQGNKKVIWNKSKRYINLQNKLKEIYRKQKDIRKLQHEQLANYIISLGDNIYVETMDFDGLKRRAKEIKRNKRGKILSKKRFGKSITNKAPSMLLGIIDRKLKYYGKKLNRIDTFSVRASQYNHVQDTYKKKKLSERWNKINGVDIQRDMYSAFLIMNVSSNLKEINRDKCNERFDNFVVLHNKEIKRLQGKNNLSSIAI